MGKSSNKKSKGEIPEDISLGSLFRKSREERHIELDEVAKATRIRRYNLEAIENEEWSKLPSQVFVKGFLRSYAEFLELDKKTVIDHYLKIPSFQKSIPEELKKIRPQSGRPYLIIIIPILALALIIALIYLSKRNISIIERAVQYFGTQSPVENKGNISAKKEIEKKEEITKKDNIEQDDTAQVNIVEETPLLEDEGVTDEVKETTVKSKPVDDTIVIKEPIIPIERKEEKSLLPRFILTANVISRTWISICSDGKPAEEYLFQAGETPRWTASKGFNITGR